MKPDYVTVAEAARLCHVSRRTIMSWLDAGKVQRLKAPNRYNVVIDRTELLTFNEGRTDNPVAPGMDPGE